MSGGSAGAIDHGKLLRRLRRRLVQQHSENEARTTVRAAALSRLRDEETDLTSRIRSLRHQLSPVRRMGATEQTALLVQEVEHLLEERAVVRDRIDSESKKGCYSGERDHLASTLRSTADGGSSLRQSQLSTVRTAALFDMRREQRTSKACAQGRPRWETGPPEYTLIGRRPTPLGETDPDKLPKRRPLPPGRPSWRATRSGEDFGDPQATGRLQLGGIGTGPGPVTISPPRRSKPHTAMSHPRPWTTAGGGGKDFQGLPYVRPPTAHEAKMAAARIRPDRLSYDPTVDGKPVWKDPGETSGMFSMFEDDAHLLSRTEQFAAQTQPSLPRSSLAALDAATAMLASQEASAMLSASPMRTSHPAPVWRGGSPGRVPRPGTAASSALYGAQHPTALRKSTLVRRETASRSRLSSVAELL
jgi:RNA-binding protein YhbY